MLEEVEILVNDIEAELGKVARRAVAVEGFPEGEVARDVGYFRVITTPSL